MAERGRYLYAVSRDLDPAALADVPGLAGGRVEVLRHAGLDAVVGEVDLTEYGEEGLRRNLERLDWLEEVARRHDDVVHAVAALGPVAPLRLATICLDDAGVRQRLDEWHAALEQVLDRVQGRREWSVKAFSRSTEPVTASATDQPGSGADYLRRKKEQTLARAAGAEDAARVADGLHTRLSAMSAASRRLPAQDPRLTGHEGTMTLNGAYLVPDEKAEDFLAVVHALQEEHPAAGVDVAGPWPPYSFAMLEQR